MSREQPLSIGAGLGEGGHAIKRRLRQYHGESHHDLLRRGAARRLEVVFRGDGHCPGRHHPTSGAVDRAGVLKEFRDELVLDLHMLFARGRRVAGGSLTVLPRRNRRLEGVAAAAQCEVVAGRYHPDAKVDRLVVEANMRRRDRHGTHGKHAGEEALMPRYAHEKGGQWCAEYIRTVHVCIREVVQTRTYLPLLPMDPSAASLLVPSVC